MRDQDLVGSTPYGDTEIPNQRDFFFAPTKAYLGSSQILKLCKPKRFNPLHEMRIILGVMKFDMRSPNGYINGDSRL